MDELGLIEASNFAGLSPFRRILSGARADPDRHTWPFRTGPNDNLHSGASNSGSVRAEHEPEGVEND